MHFYKSGFPSKSLLFILQLQLSQKKLLNIQQIQLRSVCKHDTEQVYYNLKLGKLSFRVKLLQIFERNLQSFAGEIKVHDVRSTIIKSKRTNYYYGTEF